MYTNIADEEVSAGESANFLIAQIKKIVCVHREMFDKKCIELLGNRKAILTTI